MAETFLIEIREGSGEPGFIELKPGVELAPMGVGAEGAWRVRGPGVLGVHLYLYFDGRALFAQSADQTKPAVVNGRAVGSSWTPLVAPATIALGTARLYYRPSAPAAAAAAAASPPAPDDDEDRTIAQAPPSDVDDAGADEDRTVAVAVSPPVRTTAAARPFQPGAFASRPDESTRFAPINTDEAPDSEATRVVPLTEGMAGETPELGAPAIRAMGPAARPAPVRPAAGVPWSAPATQPAGEPAPGTPGNIPPLVQRSTAPDLQRQADAGDISGQATTLYQPAQLPPRDKAGAPAPGGPALEPPSPTAANAPPGLLNVPPPQPAPGAAKPGGLAHAWKSAPTTRKILYVLLLPALGGAFWVIFSGNEPPPARTKSKPTASATATSATTATAPPTQTAAAPPPPTTTAPPQSTGNAPPPTPTTTKPQPNGGNPNPPAPSASAVADRRERTAADDVATGQYDLAAQIYDQLAREHPENPAFGEAARILRQKLDAGVR